ncbi:hypothetical protein EMOOHJMP_00143 [Microcystis phage MaAM05]|nr:hypothetical protein EMOOHJMP_00143 [Microcystis phage MaAM05]
MPASHTVLKPFQGFTLAELLISLAILGVIATFTIPKILTAQQNSQKVAIVKEIAGTIAGAYQKAQQDGVINANTTPGILFPYMNYVSAQTSGNIDNTLPWGGANPCSVSMPCYTLHNGAKIQGWSDSFGGTTKLNAIIFHIDTDSTFDNNNQGIHLLLYYNGLITTRQNMLPGSVFNSGPINVSTDPTWFSWN